MVGVSMRNAGGMFFPPGNFLNNKSETLLIELIKKAHRHGGNDRKPAWPEKNKLT